MRNHNYDYQYTDLLQDSPDQEMSILLQQEWLKEAAVSNRLPRNGDSRPGIAQTMLQIDFNPLPLANFDPAAERIIEISEVDKLIGTWQKEQYESLGVRRLKLTPDGVCFELKEAKTQGISWASTLAFEETFSFKFSGDEKSWTLHSISGLKLNGSTVTRLQADSDKLTFWMGDESSEFGPAQADYIKALIDPLLKADLRK